ncbi:MAG: hypothetical protein M3297_06300 [Thermoproteota archaeon]|nr:hypothetical protein [Thermoproteota archaeon]
MIYKEHVFLCIFSCFCLLFLFSSSSIIPATQAQGNNNTIDIEIDGKPYPLTYNITGGEISNITAIKENATLLVDVVTNNDGTLILELPRNIIDSKNPQNEDEDYLLFADGIRADAEQIVTNETVRTLSVDFDNGVEQIEIAGTRIVPEFGSLSALLLAVGVLGVLAITAKLTRFRIWKN